jgi:glycosyltransferase involved in cell wall biosynthesis
MVQTLRQIVDVLLLNGTLTECPGLVNSKMGIVVFFFHYAQYTNNMLFANYALDLIVEIQNQIHINSLVDYERGIVDVGVIPSLLEPFGYVALEMMMHELLVVVTATSRMNEVVSDTCGLKVSIIKYPDKVEIDTSLLAVKV